MRTSMEGAAHTARGQRIRASGLRGLIVPSVAAAYLAGTPGEEHRMALYGVAVVMAAVALLTAVRAEALARSRFRVPVQLAGVAVMIFGASGLALLDGGVTSPLGAL